MDSFGTLPTSFREFRRVSEIFRDSTRILDSFGTLSRSFREFRNILEIFGFFFEGFRAFLRRPRYLQSYREF